VKLRIILTSTAASSYCSRTEAGKASARQTRVLAVSARAPFACAKRKWIDCSRNAEHSMDFLLLQEPAGSLDGFASQNRDVSYSQPLTLVPKPLSLCWLLEFNV